MRSDDERGDAELLATREALEQRARQLWRTVSILRVTLEATREGILVLGPSGEVVDHNERLLQLWDLPSGSVHAGAASPLPQMAALLHEPQRLLAQLSAAGAAARSPHLLDLVDGRSFELFAADAALGDEKIGRVLSFRDVTERRQHEAALRASQAQFSAIVEHSPVGILLVDAELKLLQVNAKALPMLGGVASLLGHDLTEVLHRLWPEPVADEMLQHFTHTHATGEAHVRRGFSARRRDRQVLEHYDWELHRLILPDGRHGVACYLVDVGEHIRAQDSLRDAAQRLQLVLSAGNLGDWSWHAATDAVTLGARAAEIFGLPPTVSITWAELRDLLHPEDRETAGDAVDVAMRDRTDYEIEYRLPQADGSTVWVMARGRGVYGADGSAIGMIGVVQDVTERRRLDLAQRRLAAVVESSDDAIVSKDLHGIVQTWNTGAEHIFGYTAAEMIGQSILRLIPPELQQEEDRILDRQRRGERIQHYETIRVTKTGRRIDVSLTVSPIRDRTGRVVGASKVARDITARKHAEAQLRRSEGDLRALADSIPQLAWMADPSGSIFWFNRPWYEYTGTTLEQMQGWGWQSVHDPNILPRVLEQWRASVRSGEPLEMEFPLRGADGRFRWFLTRARPMRDETGDIQRWFGTNTDVDEVRRVREALWDESRLLNLLNETGKSIAADLDLQVLLQTVTDATTQLSGAEFGAFFYNRHDDIGDAYMLFTLSGADPEQFAFGMPRATPLFAPTFKGEGTIRLDDVLQDARYGKMGPHFGMPEGHLQVRSYLAAPVVSRSGEVIGGLFFGHSKTGMFTDRIERIITGLAAQAAVAIDNARLYERVKQAADDRQILLDAERRARAEAERSSFMKDEFLATLSHELRTPLNAIVGWSQLLRMRGNVDGDVGEGLDVIERNARIQVQLIEDLLDMSRIVSGKLRLDVQRVDVQDIVRAAIASVRHSADAKAIRMQVVLDPLAGPVWGDPNRLQQCFWNLLSNAIKFTDKGGRIQVSLARVNSHVEFTVTDDGRGIAPDFLPHVFERFRQADASTTRQHSGLGLGLSIVKNLVELHGGTVRASSAGLDQGATFRIELPVMVIDDKEPERLRQHPAAALRLSPPDNPSLEGITVLVVDDEPDARGLMRRVLEACGARVLVAESADEAFAVLQREQPDVLISDIGMPGEDGYALIRRIRGLAPEAGGRMPAAALSAFARPEDRTRALRAGYQMHLSKPVEPTELTAVVASLAQRRQ